MLAKVYTGSLYGLNSELITVETDLSVGLPALTIVGLADITVRESRERIRAAILNSGYVFPMKRITVNLAPAGTRKEGTHFDLPIAIGVLTAAGYIDYHNMHCFAMIGELSLDGRINAVNGTLPLVIGLRKRGIYQIFLPAENVQEASMIEDVVLYPVHWLRDVVNHLNGNRLTSKYVGKAIPNIEKTPSDEEPDFADVAGQEEVKRAVQIAAAAAHNLMMVGPPGSGKTMIAKRIPTILPKMTYDESLEVTKLYSIAGELSAEIPIITEQPFRAPHHSVSQAAFFGGGSRPKPGEISLAHDGVLFLDEFPEFKRNVLELLRQPLEEGKVVIGRVAGNVTYPSRVMLVAAMNPCPCGYYGDPTHECHCRPAQIETYHGKLSGPLLDRIDLQVKIMPVSYDALLNQNETTKQTQPFTSKQMRANVEAAMQIQYARYEKEEIVNNSQLQGALIKKYCNLDRQTNHFLQEVAMKFHLSARSCHKMMKVARTIADLEGSAEIQLHHMAEAVRYRLYQAVS